MAPALGGLRGKLCSIPIRLAPRMHALCPSAPPTPSPVGCGLFRSFAILGPDGPDFPSFPACGQSALNPSPPVEKCGSTLNFPPQALSVGTVHFSTTPGRVPPVSASGGVRATCSPHETTHSLL